MSQELLFHFHPWLYQLNGGELLNLSKHLDISSSETKGKSKFQVVKIVKSLFESSEKSKAEVIS